MSILVQREKSKDFDQVMPACSEKYHDKKQSTGTKFTHVEAPKLKDTIIGVEGFNIN